MKIMYWLWIIINTFALFLASVSSTLLWCLLYTVLKLFGSTFILIVFLDDHLSPWWNFHPKENKNWVYVRGLKYILGPTQNHFNLAQAVRRWLKWALTRTLNIFMPKNITFYYYYSTSTIDISAIWLAESTGISAEFEIPTCANYSY